MIQCKQGLGLRVRLYLDNCKMPESTNASNSDGGVNSPSLHDSRLAEGLQEKDKEKAKI